MRQFPWVILSLLLFAAGGVRADVVAVSDRGFVSEHVLSLDGPPAAVHRALTDDVAAWWDAAHSYSGDAANFSLDARAG